MRKKSKEEQEREELHKELKRIYKKYGDLPKNIFMQVLDRELARQASFTIMK